jgi:endogenous inhibitor of DNA gyrase (YacG/DUF329 family)
MNTTSCPICGRALPAESRVGRPNSPFCSERCRLIDLGRWLGEGYRVPSEPDTSPEDTSGEDDQAP